MVEGSFFGTLNGTEVALPVLTPSETSTRMTAADAPGSLLKSSTSLEAGVISTGSQSWSLHQ